MQKQGLYSYTVSTAHDERYYVLKYRILTEQKGYLLKFAS